MYEKLCNNNLPNEINKVLFFYLNGEISNMLNIYAQELNSGCTKGYDLQYTG